MFFIILLKINYFVFKGKNNGKKCRYKSLKYCFKKHTCRFYKLSMLKSFTEYLKDVKRIKYILIN